MRKICVLIFLFSFNLIASAGFHALSFVPGIYSVSLGGISTVPDMDPQGFWMNPSLLGRLPGNVSAGVQLSDIMISSLSISIKSKGGHSFGAGLLLDSMRIDLYDDAGLATESVFAGDMVLKGTYARSFLEERMSVGASVALIRNALEPQDAVYAFSGDIGFHYKPGLHRFPLTSIGLIVRNLGWGGSYGTLKVGNPLHVAVGVNCRLPMGFFLPLEVGVKDDAFDMIVAAGKTFVLGKGNEVLVMVGVPVADVYRYLTYGFSIDLTPGTSRFNLILGGDWNLTGLGFHSGISWKY